MLSVNPFCCLLPAYNGVAVSNQREILTVPTNTHTHTHTHTHVRVYLTLNPCPLTSREGALVSPAVSLDLPVFPLIATPF